MFASLLAFSNENINIVLMWANYRVEIATNKRVFTLNYCNYSALVDVTMKLCTP